MLRSTLIIIFLLVAATTYMFDAPSSPIRSATPQPAPAPSRTPPPTAVPVQAIRPAETSVPESRSACDTGDRINLLNSSPASFFPDQQIEIPVSEEWLDAMPNACRVAQTPSLVAK